MALPKMSSVISRIWAGSLLVTPETRTCWMSNSDDENTASAARPRTSNTTSTAAHQIRRRPAACLTAMRRALIRGWTRGPLASSGERELVLV